MNHSYDHSNLCVFLVAIWNVVGQISGITNIPISCSKYHQVIRGDIPIKIADRYEISDEKLQYMNPAMDVYNIMPGQQLCVGITRAFPAEKERDATTSAKPSDEQNPGVNIPEGMDLTTFLCGDFYAAYNYDALQFLPEKCKDEDRKAAYRPFHDSSGGTRRSRDGWPVNCANSFYCTLCNPGRRCAAGKRKRTLK